MKEKKRIVHWLTLRKVYLRQLSMLLASAPLWEWSLLGSRPTSRVHDGPLRQGDLTGRTNLTTHLAPITIASLGRPLPEHPSTLPFIQHLSTDQGSIYLPRIQSNGAKVWHVLLIEAGSFSFRRLQALMFFSFFDWLSNWHLVST